MDELQSHRKKGEITANCQTGCGFFFFFLMLCLSDGLFVHGKGYFVGLNQLKRYKG